MEVKLKIEGKEEIIQIGEINGERQLEYYKEIEKINAIEKKGMNTIFLFLDMQSKLIIKLCPRFETPEQINKLPLEEKAKLLKKITNRITGQEFNESAKN